MILEKWKWRRFRKDTDSRETKNTTCQPQNWPYWEESAGKSSQQFPIPETQSSLQWKRLSFHDLLLWVSVKLVHEQLLTINGWLCSLSYPQHPPVGNWGEVKEEILMFWEESSLNGLDPQSSLCLPSNMEDTTGASQLPSLPVISLPHLPVELTTRASASLLHFLQAPRVISRELLPSCVGSWCVSGMNGCPLEMCRMMIQVSSCPPRPHFFTIHLAAWGQVFMTFHLNSYLTL